jgi:large subunit ribosomal protein L4
MKLDLHKMDGTVSSTKVTVADKIFNVEPNDHLMYQAVVAEMANKRQGNSSTKTRSDVRGGGRKPWRQKGRGTARAGTIRSPLWIGGGRAFGPHPHSFDKKLTKKMKRLARISALSTKVKAEEVTMIEDFTVDSGKTKDMAILLQGLGVQEQKILLLIPANDKNLVQAGRNISNLQIRLAEAASTYDILNCQRVLIQKSAVEKIEKVLAS